MKLGCKVRHLKSVSLGWLGFSADKSLVRALPELREWVPLRSFLASWLIHRVALSGTLEKKNLSGMERWFGNGLKFYVETPSALSSLGQKPCNTLNPQPGTSTDCFCLSLRCDLLCLVLSRNLSIAALRSIRPQGLEVRIFQPLSPAHSLTVTQSPTSSPYSHTWLFIHRVRQGWGRSGRGQINTGVKTVWEYTPKRQKVPGSLASTTAKLRKLRFKVLQNRMELKRGNMGPWLADWNWNGIVIRS